MCRAYCGNRIVPLWGFGVWQARRLKHISVIFDTGIQSVERVTGPFRGHGADHAEADAEFSMLRSRIWTIEALFQTGYSASIRLGYIL